MNWHHAFWAWQAATIESNDLIAGTLSLFA